MNMKFDKHGYIIGGLAYKRCRQRKEREDGTLLAFRDAIEQNCFKIAAGKYRMVKKVKIREIGNFGEGHAEIGFLRMAQDLFPQLLKNKKTFKLKHMKRWIEGMAAAELGVGSKKGHLTDLSILEGDCIFGLCPPKHSDDLLYEIKHGVKRGSCK